MTNPDFDPHEKIVLRSGDIVLSHRLDRGDIAIWQAKIKLPDGSGTKRMSTKTKNRDRAKQVAEAELDEMLQKLKFGLSLRSKLFGAVSDDYLKKLKAEVATGERQEYVYKDHHRVVSTYLKPKLGKKAIDTITNADIENFADWRRAYWTTGPGSELKTVTYERAGKTVKRPVQKPKNLVPAKLAPEYAVLRQIFAEAVKQGVIKPAQVPVLKEERKRKPKVDNRRPAFTPEDWSKILRYRQQFIDAGFTDRNTERRALLYDFMSAIVASGVRPGTETAGIRWRHISSTIVKARKYVAIMIVEGKTKGRKNDQPVIAAPRAMVALRNIAQRRYAYKAWQNNPGAALDLTDPDIDYIKFMDADEQVFCLSNGEFQSEDSLRQLFETLIKQLDLVYSVIGKKHTIYSLRHTYGTQQLQAGMPEHWVAQNMGTSTKMLRDHYGQFRTTDIAEELTKHLSHL